MMTITSLQIPNIKVISPAVSLRYDEVITNQTVTWQWNACRQAIDRNFKPIIIESEIFIERALTLRGMYYTIPPRANSLFIRAISGSAYVNAVDLREFAKTYKKSAGCEITAENKKQIYIPENFGWGVLSLTDNTILLCKSTNYISAQYTKILNYADPYLSIRWPEEPQFVSHIIKSAPGISEYEAQVQFEIMREREMNNELNSEMNDELNLMEEATIITAVDET